MYFDRLEEHTADVGGRRTAIIVDVKLTRIRGGFGAHGGVARVVRG
jgi:hypothetical protein